MSERRVFVLGAGLTGLTVAYRLVTAGARVVLCERDERVGGQIHTVREDGVTVELGAEGFVARSEAVPRLCRDLGIAGALIDQATTVTFALVAGALRPLAPGEAAEILGFQIPKEELGRGIRSLEGGMGQLTDALYDAISSKVEVKLKTSVTTFERASGALRIHLEGGRSEEAHQVVVTTPAQAAAAVLSTLVGDAARALESSRRLSSASVTMAFDRDQIGHSLEGSGFIVPAAAQASGFRACSFVSTKLSRAVPPGVAVLRAFFRPTVEDLELMTDEAWAALALASVTGPLGIEGSPRRSWVSVWPRALPVYDDEYRQRVSELELSIGPMGVSLAGSHFHGAGIDAAIVSAESVAKRVLGLGG